MVQTSQGSKDKLIISMAVVVSVIFTPLNFDALIIPKVTIIFCFGLYMFPSIIGKIRKIEVSRKVRLSLTLIPIITLLHLTLVMLISSAPLDQQIFGRTGRAFGFITYFSFILLILSSIIYMRIENINLLIMGIIVSALLSSGYSMLQKYELDIFNWNSRTNGIIGTLGNPNFQSSFAALAFIPTVVYFWQKKYKPFTVPVFALFILFTIYICQSTQGYVGVLAAILAFLFIKIWFDYKRFFYSLLIFPIALVIIAVAGMLNRGPLSYYLYKISVQSRGDFWRSAFTTANENPLFGVGLDSFGDYYLLNRDQIAANHTFAELTDNAHNYFLEFAATGGYPLALLYFAFISYALFSFLVTIKKGNTFNPQLSALFAAWSVLQLQSIISPGNLVLFIWNFIISGAVIGFKIIKRDINSNHGLKRQKNQISLIGSSLLVVGLLIIYPWFNNDRILLLGLNTKNANLVIQAANSYPRSVVKINLVTIQLFESNLPAQSLDLARSATKWNPNAVSGWGLILANPTAPFDERVQAKEQVLRLDPLNKKIKEFKF